MSTISNAISLFETGEFSNKTPLGDGAQGYVSKADHKSLGVVAVKYFRNGTIGTAENIQREIKYIGQIHNHENNVSLFGYVVEKLNSSSNIIGYAMEYMEDGSLHEVIHNPSIEYSLVDVARWATQASMALAFLHSKDILHRDVKPKNMLLTNERKTLKICDFGSLRAKNVNEMMQSMSMTLGVGTLLYMAPELLSETKETGKYSKKCDVYSLGVTLWEMSTRRLPFHHLECSNVFVLRKLIAGGERLLFELVTDLTLREIITRCASIAESKRPTMERLPKDLSDLHLREYIKFPEGKIRQIPNGKWINFDLAFNPKSDALASMCLNDQQVRLWDFTATDNIATNNAELLRSYLSHLIEETENVRSVSWSNHGTMLATGGREGNLRIFLRDGTLKLQVRVHFGPIFELAWSPNDDYILSVDGASAVVFDIASGKQIQGTLLNKLNERAKAFWMNEDTFVLCGRLCFRVIRLGFQEPAGYVDFLNNVFEQRLNLLATWTNSPAKLKVLSLPKEEPLWTKTFENTYIVAVRFSPIGNILATCSFCVDGENAIKIWDFEQNTLLQELGGPSKWESLAFSPCGKYLATGGVQQQISIWNVQKGTLLQKHCGPDVDVIRRIFWNARGEKIVATDRKGTIHLLDVRHMDWCAMNYPTFSIVAIVDEDSASERCSLM